MKKSLKFILFIFILIGCVGLLSSIGNISSGDNNIDDPSGTDNNYNITLNYDKYIF